jgi:broad specificity phosphatase PhoE
MATIYLLRHGQASFGTSNYDVLSPTGQRQSKVLGQHLVRLGLKFDAMVSGTMSRQKDTAVHARSEMANLDGDVVVDAAFNEYDADGLFKGYLPRALREHPELAEKAAHLFRDRALFQQSFVAVTRYWLEGHPPEGIEMEPWAAFQSRVQDGLKRLNDNHDRKANIAVFTSGGAISVGVAMALGLASYQTLQVNYGIYNASITEMKFGRSGIHLLGFNNIAHLQLAGDPALITHR